MATKRYIVAILSASLLPFIGAFHPPTSLSSRPRLLVHTLASPKSASATTADEATSDTSKQNDNVAFVTPPMHVYIEDTDYYGVMYNANYLRAYERALHLMSTRPPSYVKAYHESDNNKDDTLPLLNGGALDHAGWFVLGVTEHKFKGSPALGGEFVVEGELVERDCEQSDSSSGGACVETWKLEMKSPPPSTNEEDIVEEESKPTVYNTATITIASPTESGTLPRQYHPKTPPFDGSSGGSTVRSTFEPFRDEFDPTLKHRMPIRNVLNLFERARTDYLGGPDELRKMEQEDSVVWVVTSIDNCELCNLGEAGWEESDELLDEAEAIEENDNNAATSLLVQCTPGRSVTVKTNFVSKRKGMILECNQTLLVSAWDDDIGAYRNRRLAQGVITIMALDAKTRQPTRKIPQWFIDKINSGGD